MNPRQEAENIIEMFKQPTLTPCEHSRYCQERECLDINGNVWCHVDKDSAIQCAIKHVEGILEEIPKEIHGWADVPTNILIVGNPRRHYWNDILTELKQM